METPGDGQGELLVSVQLIHTTNPDLPKPQSIIPKTRTVRHGMVCGCHQGMGGMVFKM